MPAAARSDDSSAGRSARASPSGSAPSSSGPTAIRTRSRTSRPIAANSRRTSRLRPSAMTTSTTESDPERLALERSRRAVLELDAGGELLELLGGDRAVEGCQVALGDAVTRMRDRVSEVAVGGEHEQPAAVGVEPADRNETRNRFDQVHHGAALIRITARRDHTDRLVEDDGDGNCTGRESDARRRSRGRPTGRRRRRADSPRR